jgi:hypothetical protein
MRTSRGDACIVRADPPRRPMMATGLLDKPARLATAGDAGIRPYDRVAAV